MHFIFYSFFKKKCKGHSSGQQCLSTGTAQVLDIAQVPKALKGWISALERSCPFCRVLEELFF